MEALQCLNAFSRFSFRFPSILYVEIGITYEKAHAGRHAQYPFSYFTNPVFAAPLQRIRVRILVRNDSLQSSYPHCDAACGIYTSVHDIWRTGVLSCCISLCIFSSQFSSVQIKKLLFLFEELILSREFLSFHSLLHCFPAPGGDKSYLPLDSFTTQL